jgi:hypothetical protein
MSQCCTWGVEHLPHHCRLQTPVWLLHGDRTWSPLPHQTYSWLSRNHDRLPPTYNSYRFCLPKQKVSLPSMPWCGHVTTANMSVSTQTIPWGPPTVLTPMESSRTMSTQPIIATLLLPACKTNPKGREEWGWPSPLPPFLRAAAVTSAATVVQWWAPLLKKLTIISLLVTGLWKKVTIISLLVTGLRKKVTIISPLVIGIWKKVTIISLLDTGVWKKSNDYFATRYWSLKKSNDYFATRYFPHRKCNDLLITSTCYFPHTKCMVTINSLSPCYCPPSQKINRKNTKK